MYCIPTRIVFFFMSSLLRSYFYSYYQSYLTTIFNPLPSTLHPYPLT